MSEEKLPKVDLASQALSDADVTTLQTVDSSARFVRGFFARSSLEDSDLSFVPFRVPDFSKELCLTDQSHALTIGDMVRRGVQDVGSVSDSDYDFPDGKDDGRTVDQFLSWREPAELSEREHTVLGRMADNAAKNTVLSALEKVASKTDTQSGTKISSQTHEEASLSASQEKKE